MTSRLGYLRRPKARIALLRDQCGGHVQVPASHLLQSYPEIGTQVLLTDGMSSGACRAVGSDWTLGRIHPG